MAALAEATRLAEGAFVEPDNGSCARRRAQRTPVDRRDVVVVGLGRRGGGYWECVFVRSL